MLFYCFPYPVSQTWASWDFRIMIFNNIPGHGIVQSVSVACSTLLELQPAGKFWGSVDFFFNQKNCFLICCIPWSNSRVLQLVVHFCVFFCSVISLGEGISPILEAFPPGLKSRVYINRRWGLWPKCWTWCPNCTPDPFNQTLIFRGGTQAAAFKAPQASPLCEQHWKPLVPNGASQTLT